MGVVVWRDDGCKTAVKENDKRFFTLCGGWESSGLERVACGDGADSMLQFLLERGGDGTSVVRR
jgi:hypothetical protein